LLLRRWGGGETPNIERRRLEDIPAPHNSPGSIPGFSNMKKTPREIYFFGFEAERIE
jgi:hypothetical protein